MEEDKFDPIEDQLKKYNDAGCDVETEKRHIKEDYLRAHDGIFDAENNMDVEVAKNIREMQQYIFTRLLKSTAKFNEAVQTLESQVPGKNLKLNNLEMILEMNKNQTILPDIVLHQIIDFLTKDVSIFTQDKEYMKTHCA